MKGLDNNTEAFLTLIRAGLWEKEARLLHYKNVDYGAVYELATEQSVVGLIAAGLEHVVDIKIPKENALSFAGDALQLEQRNTAMNCFIGVLVDKMKAANIFAVLIKGQGIAQCYERPLWRTSGDIDFILSNNNYYRAKELLLPLAFSIQEEDFSNMHLCITIDSWVVELHGSFPCGVSRRADLGIDIIKKAITGREEVRSWINGNSLVYLPSVDNDVIFVFTHYLKHFFYGGIGLRQICDLCRLLWTYREKINKRLLEKRIRSMGLMSEWRAFAALAVNTLGMPVEAMPLYDSSSRWRNKANMILSMILETGNFGHNRDESFYQKHSFLAYKAIAFWRNTWDSMRHMMIFPVDATRVWFKRLAIGIRVAAKGK